MFCFGCNKKKEEMRIKPKNFDRMAFYNAVKLFLIQQKWIKAE
jgi:hypothetical protein